MEVQAGFTPILFCGVEPSISLLEDLLDRLSAGERDESDAGLDLDLTIIQRHPGLTQSLLQSDHALRCGCGVGMKRIRANSSPPILATTSEPLTLLTIARATWMSTASPTGWPCRSLISLKPSRSRSTSVTGIA